MASIREEIPKDKRIKNFGEKINIFPFFFSSHLGQNRAVLNASHETWFPATINSAQHLKYLYSILKQ